MDTSSSVSESGAFIRFLRSELAVLHSAHEPSVPHMVPPDCFPFPSSFRQLFFYALNTLRPRGFPFLHFLLSGTCPDRIPASALHLEPPHPLVFIFPHPSPPWPRGAHRTVFS